MDHNLSDEELQALKQLFREEESTVASDVLRESYQFDLFKQTGED